MACGCIATTCLGVKFNPCSEGAALPLYAAYTGDMRGEIEFNGSWTEFSVGVTFGETIVIPVSVLNEYYSHTLKLYDESEELVGATCYTIEARAMVGAGDFPVVPAGALIEVFDVTITADGTTFTDSRLLDGTVMLLNTNAQAYNSPFFTKTFASDTLTGVDIAFYAGQIVTVTIKR